MADSVAQDGQFHANQATLDRIKQFSGDLKMAHNQTRQSSKSATTGRRAIALLFGAGLIAAACSSGGNSDTVSAPSEAPAATDAPTSSPATTAPPTTVAETTTTLDPVEVQTIEQVNDYIAEAAAFDQAGADAQFPQGVTFAAGGAPGY
ncbi:MAG: hypothetical protein DRJ50_02510, partial [Actinobacteria bacterium]